MDFKNLNLSWISHYFEVEQKDLKQLDHPESIIRGGGEIYFALLDNIVVGCCAIIKINDKEFEIAKMAVSEKARGQGIGDGLIKVVEEYAWSKGAQRIVIYSNSSLEPAIRLYKKHGYKVLNTEPHPDYIRCNITLDKYY